MTDFLRKFANNITIEPLINKYVGERFSVVAASLKDLISKLSGQKNVLAYVPLTTKREARDHVR